PPSGGPGRPSRGTEWDPAPPTPGRRPAPRPGGDPVRTPVGTAANRYGRSGDPVEGSSKTWWA
ncbi:MAG TPA: NADH-quinone oxidoreductase subunit C, partial [Acidimicrobiia bacterium]|nr:NADH-quinone oxidoreductase subunit C [Acidimicrobiia bacterium]